MTTIENHQLKGITIKNVIVTIASTASIVVSVMTTYFGLKTDILAIKAAQDTEARVNNLRIKMLESEVVILQKQVNEIQLGSKPGGQLSINSVPSKATGPAFASVIEK
jgi:hypothetical protein